MGGIKKVGITVTTNASGTATVVSNIICGKVLKILYDKGTITATTTATTVITESVETIGSIDVNVAAKQSQYPVVALTGTSAGDNKWGQYVVDGTLTVTTAGGDALHTFYVYVYYEMR
jgi:hypothetical protein